MGQHAWTEMLRVRDQEFLRRHRFAGGIFECDNPRCDAVTVVPAGTLPDGWVTETTLGIQLWWCSDTCAEPPF